MVSWTRSFGTNSVITYGPVPIGKSRKSGLLAETGSSLKEWAGRIGPLTPPVNASNHAADGVANVATAVSSSGVSMPEMASQVRIETAALSGLRIHSQVNWMSREVNGSPSLQSRPSCSSVSYTHLTLPTIY